MRQNWKTFKLKDLTTKIGSGATPRGGKGAYKESGISLVRSQNVLDFSFSSDGLAFIDDDQAAALKNVILESQDVLLNITGDSVARVCKVPDHWLPARVNQHVAIVRANEKILNPDFLLYSLLSKENKNLLLTMAGAGATRNALTKTMIEEFEISVPEIQEQKSIASILSALDDKIELNLQMNKTLEEMALALYKHWFVDFGPFQDGEFVATELGEIPKGWEVKSIGELVKIIGGFAFKSKDFNETGETVVKIKNISNNVVSIAGSDCIGSEIGAKINQKFLINPGSFLVAMTGAEVGKVGVVPDYNQKLWLNQRVGMITDPRFESADILIGNFLQSPDGYEIIQNLAFGSAQPNISATGLENISLPIPKDISVIAELLKKLENWHQMKIANYTENITLTKLRDTLLPKLISGELRVKDVEKTLSEVL